MSNAPTIQNLVTLRRANGFRFQVFEVTAEGRHVHRGGAHTLAKALDLALTFTHSDVWNAITFEQINDLDDN